MYASIYIVHIFHTEDAASINDSETGISKVTKSGSCLRVYHLHILQLRVGLEGALVILLRNLQ